MRVGYDLSRTERVWMARLYKGPRMQRVMGDEAVNKLVNRGYVVRTAIKDPRKPQRTLGYALAFVAMSCASHTKVPESGPITVGGTCGIESSGDPYGGPSSNGGEAMWSSANGRSG